MKKQRHVLWLIATLFCTIAQATTAEETKPTIQLQDDWLFLRNHEEPTKQIYRRYTVLTNGAVINLMNFVCMRNSGKSNYIMLKWTSDFNPPTLIGKDWERNLEVGLLINQKTATTFLGEYIHGELFLDRTSANTSDFDAIAAADDLSLDIGGFQIKYGISRNMSGFLKEYLEQLSPKTLGPYDALSYEQVLQRCAAYRGE